MAAGSQKIAYETQPMSPCPRNSLAKRKSGEDQADGPEALGFPWSLGIRHSGAPSPRRGTRALHRVVDPINERYGELAIAPGRLLNCSAMPNVISPAWKPQGSRPTIG